MCKHNNNSIMLKTPKGVNRLNPKALINASCGLITLCRRVVASNVSAHYRLSAVTAAFR